MCLMHHVLWLLNPKANYPHLDKKLQNEIIKKIGMLTIY